MLIKTSRRSPISVMPRTEQINIPREILAGVPRLMEVDVSLVIAWTGVMRVHLKSGLLQKNLIRFYPMLRLLSGKQDIKTSLLTHKLLSLPDLTESNVKEYVENCIIPQGYAHGLADKKALITPSEGRKLIVLFSDGKCTNKESIVQEISNHQVDTCILMITFSSQVQELWLRVAQLPNSVILNGSRIDNETIYEDMKDICEDILLWYERCC